MTQYKIDIYGFGVQTGVSKVSKKIYNFWKDREDLAEATDPYDPYDFESLGIEDDDELCLGTFWDYTNTVAFTGILIDRNNDVTLHVSKENAEVCRTTYNESNVKDIKSVQFPKRVSAFNLRIDSPSKSDLAASQYLCWERSGDGSWSGTIEIDDEENFHLSELSFETVEYCGATYIVKVKYKGDYVDPYDNDFDWCYQEVRMFESSNKKGSSQKWSYEIDML